MSAHLIILGAGPSSGVARPFGLDGGAQGRRILAWQLAAFRRNYPDGRVTFVGGYQIEQISRAFPDLTYIVNGQWRETGALASLVLALEHVHEDDAPDNLFILYGDVLVRSELFAKSSDRLLIGIDFEMPTKALRGQPGEAVLLPDGKEAEFIGFVCVPRKEFLMFKQRCWALQQEFAKRHLSVVVCNEMPELALLKFEYLEAQGFWSHGENSRAVAQFIMGSKAATLSRLRSRLRLSQVLPLQSFTLSEWQADADVIIKKICAAFSGERYLVVRSSARDEDGFAKANAGKYHSELKVPATPAGVEHAIKVVFASYGVENLDDEVLVQPQLENVASSGVLFTRQLGSGAPYYVINYARGNDTTAITSGLSVKDETIILSRNADPAKLTGLPEQIGPLVAAAAEIEQAVLYDALDIEFAVLNNGTIITLQCRPLMLRDYLGDRQWDDLVFDVQVGLKERFGDIHHDLLGDVPLWSVMADWNPAEIVGTKPGGLALDLYRYVITDRTWAVQRKQVGYRDVTHVPLVSNLAGTAYVNVRASLNSFVPADFAEAPANRLVGHALQRLRANPALHDKIEFEIIPTCMDFTFDRWSNLYETDQVLSPDETSQLAALLRQVTQNIISRTSNDFAQARQLEKEYDALISQSAPLGAVGIKRLLDRCQQEGALVFAHLARAGFVAVGLMKSAVVRGLISAQRYQQAMASIETVGTLLQREARAVREGASSKDALVARFGHIRPGTYDIATSSYSQAYDTYLAPLVDGAQASKYPEFCFSAVEAMALEAALKHIGLPMSASEFLQFVREAVAGREFSKLIFTKLISAALDMIRKDQLDLGIKADDLEFLSLSTILNRPQDHWGDTMAKMQMLAQIERRRALSQVASRILLPPVLTGPDEVMGFVQPQMATNFVTENRAERELVILRSAGSEERPDLSGKIVAIPSADPGYDFLFGMNIAGLVTAFGGPNSHMAIRAAEFQLPAAIGVGQHGFDQLSDGALYVLDCGQKILRPVHMGAT